MALQRLRIAPQKAFRRNLLRPRPPFGWMASVKRTESRQTFLCRHASAEPPPQRAPGVAVPKTHPANQNAENSWRVPFSGRAWTLPTVAQTCHVFHSRRRGHGPDHTICCIEKHHRTSHPGFETSLPWRRETRTAWESTSRLLATQKLSAEREPVALVRQVPDLDAGLGQAEVAMDHQAETAVEGAEDQPVTAVVLQKRFRGMARRTSQLARRGIGRAAEENYPVGQASSLPFAQNSQAGSLRHGRKPTAARLSHHLGIHCPAVRPGTSPV